MGASERSPRAKKPHAFTLVEALRFRRSSLLTRKYVIKRTLRDASGETFSLLPARLVAIGRPHAPAPASSDVGASAGPRGISWLLDRFRAPSDHASARRDVSTDRCYLVPCRRGARK